MYNETLKKMISNAVFKTDMAKKDFLRYFVLSILAGIYIAIAMFFVFSIAAPFHVAGSPSVKLLLGVGFAVGLTIVVFAGSELFTGNVMYMTIGSLSGETSISDLGLVWIICFIGNLAGGLLFALFLKLAGLLDNEIINECITYYASTKMNASIIQLFFRGILCNMMVCLSLWMCARTKEDTAKLILIFWCLFAFVSSGFEHSVANMSFLAMALFTQHSAEISLIGYCKNLVYVTLGNIVGGAFIGGVYWYVSNYKVAINHEKKENK